MGACASANGSNNSSGVCRDNLLVTGKKPGDKDVPLDWNGWEDDEKEVWPNDTPGQSDDDLVASDFVPPSDVVGGPDADQLGGTGEIVGENPLGDAPEPSTMLLMGGGLFALGFYRKKRSS